MKKVRITTKCGQTSILYVDQDIVKITVDGENFAKFDYKSPKNEEAVGCMLRSLLGGTWKWHTNQDEATFKESLAWYHEAEHSEFAIPEDPADIMYVPHHWTRNGTKREDGAVGVYFRTGVKMVNPRHVFLSTP